MISLKYLNTTVTKQELIDLFLCWGIASVASTMLRGMRKTSIYTKFQTESTESLIQFYDYCLNRLDDSFKRVNKISGIRLTLAYLTFIVLLERNISNLETYKLDQGWYSKYLIANIRG